MALDRIVARTRERLEMRKERRPLSDLFEGLAPSDRSFEGALREGAPAFILEVKPRSPSKGALRSLDDLVPVIDAYRQHAAAISVLTEPEFFGGSHELLRRVRAAVSQPVLAKDFILDPYQVAEARYHGADAVLLMLSILDDATYAACAAMAGQLGMSVLTEVHTAHEMRRAAVLNARIIGVNNRDLVTLRVDVSTTGALAPLAPPGALVIAESGLDDRPTFERVMPFVDGALVGSSLMQARDVARAVRTLVYGETKICGLTRPDDAHSAHLAGATHGGVVFHAPSPRAVTDEQARAVIAAAPLRWVGVFVNERLDRVADLAALLALSAVQLHGDEGVAEIAALRTMLPTSCEVWKGMPIRDTLPETPMPGVDLTLFDGYDRVRRGGTGRVFDWNLLGSQRLQYPFGVAGGLSPHNAGLASELGARLLDVSSGVESSPGCKDPALVAAFLRARSGRSRTRSAGDTRALERVA